MKAEQTNKEKNNAHNQSKKQKAGGQHLLLTDPCPLAV
jgi:hypothetical protein